MTWAAGVYSRGYPSWSADAASNLPISATKFDTEDNDFAGGLNNCLTKDGLSAPSSAMTWGLAGAQVLALTRGNDGNVFSIARTGGVNNPIISASVQDATGWTLSTNFGALTIANANVSVVPVKITSTFSQAAATPTLQLQSTAANGFSTLSICSNTGTAGTNDLSIFQNGTNRDATILNRAASNLFLGTGGNTILSMFSGLQVGSPTGGDKGAGSINAQSIYVNGTAVGGVAETSGTFTPTITGFASVNAPGASWTKTGSTVTLYLTGVVLSGTSNATTFTITNIPAGLTPANAQQGLVGIVDSGSASVGLYQISGTTLSFGKGIQGAGGFTASGTKGLANSSVFNWSVL